MNTRIQHIADEIVWREKHGWRIDWPVVAFYVAWLSTGGLLMAWLGYRMALAILKIWF